MLLIIATSAGVLWAAFLAYEVWKNRKCSHLAPPRWVMDMRAASLRRIVDGVKKRKERFDGIWQKFKVPQPDSVMEEAYIIPVKGGVLFPLKGGEENMAKGKSPVKEKKKPKKSKKK